LFNKPHPQRKALVDAKIFWPIASIVLGADTILEADKQNEEKELKMPQRIISFKAYKISNASLLFICELKSVKRLVTIDSSRLLGYHGFNVKAPDVVPPFSLKLDTNSIKLALGQSSGGKLSAVLNSLPNMHMNMEQREYFVGVPFSSSGLNFFGGPMGSLDFTDMIGRPENKIDLLRRENDLKANSYMSYSGKSGATLSVLRFYEVS
jgi:hypothetical protein